MTRIVRAAPGTNLFQISSQVLGDAAQWILIARINNIRDPFITDIISLVIPESVSAAMNGVPRQP